MKRVCVMFLMSLLMPVLAYAATLTVTVTTDKASYPGGQVVKTTAVFKRNGSLYDTSTLAKITIKNPSGSTVVNAANMTKQSAGTYTYNYTLSTSAPTGTWTDSCSLSANGNSGTGSTTFAVTAADTTPPVTTASPAGGTYTSVQTVTLTANEAATTYYTTDGTTPVYPVAGTTRTYSAPITISATTTLKYFSRDTAGNSEAVKTDVYTLNIVKTHDVNNASLVWNGYGTCLSCHRQQASDMYQSVHYQWKGSAAKMTTGPTSQGKMDALDGSSALNAYCVNILGDWNACGACHTGTGAKPVATQTPTDAQLSSIDCLMCHKDPSVATPYARTRNATTGLFEPNAGIDMNLVLRTAKKPVRGNCLGCHAKAGGGDAVKRGDIALASGTTADTLFDIHMATDGGNLACQQCHAFTAHKVSGRGTDLRPLDSTVALNCSNASCHPTKNSLTSGHTTVDTDHHTGRVACQTCHLPKYAKNANDTTATEATETDRTWEIAEWNATLNRYEPAPTKANDLTPKYAFWDGTSWGNNLGDAAVLDSATNAYKVSRPNGAINGAAGTKLYPFKYKTSHQALDTTTGKLIGLNTATFFATGNYTQAVLDGLANMGRSGDAWQTVTTDEYQVLNHQIPPATGNVLACADCHKNTARINLPAMGYAIKAPTSTICIQCHGMQTYPDYKWVHDKHVTSLKYDCSFCHNFSRAAERGLKTTK
ncbi:MAG TPA: chitobiase/beta-hexosaminidase C-terminal domain-containing protein [Geobacteraceae bacterium]